MSVASSVERQMLDLINTARAEAGAAPLKLELDLNEAAEDHSVWMLGTDTFSHTGANGSSAGDRMANAGFVFSGSWSWGENIAWQSERGASGIADDVENLFQSLMNSPGHRANILSAGFDYVGIGVETGNFGGWNAVMVTQTFASTGATVDLDTGASKADPAPPRGVISGTDAGEVLRGGVAADILKGRGGDDRLFGAGADDTLYGHKGADLLKGGSGGDALYGGVGRDVLRGNQGSDALHGGNQADVLDGGGGQDALTGGRGADSFTFRAGYGRDTITDFENDVDTIRLDDSLWSGGLGKAEVLERFASAKAGDVILDFGKSQLVVEGLDSVADLRDDMVIV